MECVIVRQGHVSEISGFYCGVFGCWVDVVAGMGMFGLV